MKGIHRRQVFQAKFKRDNGAGYYTAVFDQLPDKAQRYVAEHMSYRDEEYPAVAHFVNAGHWTLVTTQRVIVMINGSRTEIDHADLLEADGLFNHESKIPGGHKLEMFQVCLHTRTTEPLVISLEKGPSFLAMWNLLSHVAYAKPTG